MRKLQRVLCLWAVVMIAGLFTACAMIGDGTEYTDDQTPYEMEIYMQVDTAAHPITAGTFPAFKNTIENITADREGYYTNAAITVNWDTPLEEDDTATFTIDVKIDSVKQRSSFIESDLWYRYQTVRMFNPLNVLNRVDGVVYYFGAAWETRMTDVPNSVASRGEDGSYQYIWYTDSQVTPAWDWENGDIVLNNKYANTPMWYAAAILIAGAAGVIVYFACKKSRKKDIIQ